jgi:murein DD-endopeptidase MepM/ murein hydrolase activator NlpD
MPTSPLSEPATWRDHPVVQHRQERGRRHALAPESADAAQAYLDLLASTTPLSPLAAPAPAALTAPAPAAPTAVALGAPAAAPATPAAPTAPAPTAPAAVASAIAASSAVPGPDDDAARAYLALLGSSRPLDPAAPGPAPEPAATGWRFHSHRAPARGTVPFALLGQRGRSAVLTAALIAGVSVAGFSTATANAHSAAQASSRTAAHTPLDPATGTDALPAGATTTGTDATTTGTDALPTGTDATTTGTDALPTGAAALPTGTDALPIEATVAGSDASIAALPTDATAAGRDAGTAALAAAQAERDANQVSTGGALAATPLQRKTRPLPKVTAAWVNPLPEGAVTSCFGQRWGRLHAGVDLATASGTPIRAAGTGTVVAAGPADGYGNAVLIDHGNGYLTHYGHMSEITATVGQKVRAGQQIGLEGSTGHSTGPHLHFEVHKGYYQNPIEPTRWMHKHGVDIPGCADLTDDEH